MDAIYFLVFCLTIAFVIFWSMRNDDQAEFTGQERSKRFVVSKKTQVDVEDDEITEK